MQGKNCKSCEGGVRHPHGKGRGIKKVRIAETKHPGPTKLGKTGGGMVKRERGDLPDKKPRWEGEAEQKER